MAMEAKGLNASNLARQVWGETTDNRGYKVAKNRDRIGHYLAGVSFPEEDNLQRLAAALGLPYEELAVTKPPTGPGSAYHSSSRTLADRNLVDTQLSILAHRPSFAILQLKRQMRLDTALTIIRLLKAEDDADGNDDEKTADEPAAHAE